MATAREIHRHMKSVGNIGKITKAMKMVAAARLRRAQEKKLLLAVLMLSRSKKCYPAL